MILELKNNNNTYTFNVEDLNNGEKLYFNFQIPTTDIPNGKYNAVLYDGDRVVAEDIICIGDFNSQTIQYNRGQNVYINAPLQGKIEQLKSVVIDTIDFTIYPNEEYDAMKEVIVNAQPIYEQGSTDGYNRGTVDGYNNGFNQGKTEGLTQGIEQGKEEQKSKLVPLTVTENGSYSRTDGYSEVNVMVEDVNGSYDEGYTDGFDAGVEKGINDAGEIIAESARVLDITENGIYTSQYSEFNDYVKPTVTGVFEDGKGFYNEGYPFGQMYSTNTFTITPQTKIELWIKPIQYTWDSVYLSASNNLPINEFKLSVNYASTTKNSFKAKIGLKEVNIDLTETEYKKIHHIIMSFNDGFWLDGIKIGDFEGDFDIKNNQQYFKINPSAANIGASANYGMLKIDDIIIIPTADGFLNTNANELLSYENALTSAQYQYINNFTEPIAEGNLIRTVNVNVQPKIDVAESGLKFGRSTFKELPNYLDFSNCTDMSNMFENTNNLQTIPLIDTSNVTNMSAIFQGSGIKNLPLIDTSNVTNMNFLFTSCTGLKTIPLINTSKVSSAVRMFSASGIETIPQIDTSNVENAERMFYNCSSLYSIPPLNAEKMNLKSYGIFGGTLGSLTDFGGLIGLKSSSNNSYSFNSCPNLTYQSCINVLNGLYDFMGNGETPNSNQGQLKVHPNFLTTVGDEISIGTSKGWSISA